MNLIPTLEAPVPVKPQFTCTAGTGAAVCPCCLPAAKIAHPLMSISVGFGQAIVTMDGITVHDGEETERDGNPAWTVAEAEAFAAPDPNHDWRIIMDAPGYSRIYQRQAPNRWLLIKDEEGFA